jgi:RNA polymerase sigma factor (sigma-70 family)
MTTKEHLVESHQALAAGTAKKYANRGLPWEDLRQEAMLGLLKAADLFREDMGAEFSTYAVYWIRKYILTALEKEKRCSLGAEDLGETDPVLPHQQISGQEAAALPAFPEDMPAQERKIMLLTFGRKLTLKEISAATGMSVEKVKQLRGKAFRRLKSHNSPKHNLI